jgi:hypothetical protein
MYYYLNVHFQGQRVKEKINGDSSGRIIAEIREHFLGNILCRNDV